VSMLFAQLTHAIGLNDVCDALRMHSGPLSALRGATPPSRNNLSHANKHRDAALAERLFWAMLDHLQKLSPGFAAGRRGKGLARRFRRIIHIVDSSTIALIASCIDWAQHRRRKAAAKLHVRLDLHSLLPRFVLVESAKAADSIRAAELCAAVKPGEIVIFDRAYVDFAHLCALNDDGVFWVTRSKESLGFRVVKKLPKAADKRILSDQLVVLKNKDSRANYPRPMRLVRALVEVDGKEREMEFLTNNLSWSAGSVADLYRCRWQIEVFFKQIKQSLQLCDFLGNSANAVRWQVWTALLLYVLMRFLCVISSWNHSFTRLFTLLRAALWRKIDLWDLLRFCGTAAGHFRYLATPQNAYFPGFA
jgi:Transposase DDE domain